MLAVPLPTIRPAATLTAAQAAAVDELQQQAAALDGVRPLSEQTLLSLSRPAAGVAHFPAYAAEQLVGYAQLAGGDDGDRGGERSGELVVHPDHRRRGVGAALLRQVLHDGPQARLWAHGNLEAAQALAASSGLEVVRELHKMARALTRDDTDPQRSTLPPGFRSRAFEPGRDEVAWLTTNAAAFAHHPEQGRLALPDLQERMRQPWFDPTGLILVEDEGRPGQVAAFHWTKVDPATAGEATGEVYVVGVHPAYQGRGLGRPVTALGLAHLAGLGLTEVVLYVDGDNQAALRTYTGLGFRSIMVDVMYSRTGQRALSG
jgi:mycothiol synthase